MERMTQEQLKDLYSTNRKLFLELANKWYAEDPEYYTNQVYPIINEPVSQPPKKKKTSKIIFLVALGILGALMLLCFLSRDNFNKSSKSSNKTKDIEKSTDEYREVAASDLFSAYKNNEVSADNQYKGKSFKITGGVQKIDKDFMNNIIVNLKTENQFMSVRCYLEDSQNSKAANLKIGDFVKMVGKGDGMIIGSPIVKDCVIVQVQ